MALKKTTSKPKATKKAAGPDSRSKWVFLLFGGLFGYMLSKASATDYDTIIDMFRPTNLHVDRTPSGWYWHLEALRLYGVLGMAVAVIALGLFLLQRSKKPTWTGKPLDWESQTWNPDRILGSFVFGAGWALSGVCPGTALAQVGEGKVVAFFTVAGIVAGVWAYQKFKGPSSNKEQVC
ncbi:MAG TPA: DUF6691 family protein [bacterium]|nr:DUF6691 family protein [bacterium]